MAGLHEGGRWQVWIERPLLLPVPQVAPHVQRLLFPGELQLHHHPPAGLRRSPLHIPVHRTGTSHGNGQFTLLHPRLFLWAGGEIVNIRAGVRDYSPTHFFLFFLFKFLLIIQ